MLPRTSLGDESCLPGFLGEQRLADAVVDLVRTPVQEVLALEEHVRTVAFREGLGVVQRCRPPRVVFEDRAELVLELVGGGDRIERVGEFGERFFHDFGNVPTAEALELPRLPGFVVAHRTTVLSGNAHMCTGDCVDPSRSFEI